MLRRKSIAHPFTGVNVIGGVPQRVVARAEAYAVLLRPDELYSHSTAAILWGAQLPRTLGSGPLHVLRLGDARARGRGVVGHRSDPGLVHGTLLDGLPVVAPSDAWVQLASMLALEDLVAVGDRFVTGLRVPGGRGSAVATRAHLAGALSRHTGSRGLRNARTALPLIREGVDSRRETWLRLLLVFAGLPEPEVGVRIDVGWSIPLQPDLAYPQLKVALEYEGDAHRTDPVRFRHDIARREAMEAAGWRVVRVTSDDLRDGAAFVARVRTILRERSISARF